MKKYFYYLIYIFKAIGLIALIITPALLAIMISYYTNNWYYLFILTSYIFITPILCVIAENTGFTEILKKEL